jgi:uncharacterized protein
VDANKTIERASYDKGVSMGLREQLNEDMKLAMKSGDKRRLGTIRLMTAAIKDKDINSRTEGHDSDKLPDSALLDLFAKMVKQRQDSITAYEQGNRPELAQQEREEMEIIQTYMPKQLSDDETKAAIAGIIAAVGATSVKDMGKVMAELKTKFSGQIDMGKAGGVVKSLLG